MSEFIKNIITGMGSYGGATGPILTDEPEFLDAGFSDEDIADLVLSDIDRASSDVVRGHERYQEDG